MPHRCNRVSQDRECGTVDSLRDRNSRSHGLRGRTFAFAMGWEAGRDDRPEFVAEAGDRAADPGLAIVPQFAAVAQEAEDAADIAEAECGGMSHKRHNPR